ncbi:Mitotic spindle-associated MMXD complex subunit MIP18 [Perkinsus chesapeaki]|uniref:Mitotic spindle-associated MMXD complex subunit MIP18 n=1 Tax=Perkinsus chesapeaki TaxID=330153 RepID=A0A7J6MBR1_PERCH|nr:Mitotic spindle-associated MMXD complex subunit MIP18 [Perkinsus chesapeaki]
MSLSIVDEDFDVYDSNPYHHPLGKRHPDRRVRRLSSVSLSRLMTCPISQVFVVTQDELGHGATATVRKVIHKRTGEEFALKSLPKRDLTPLQKKILLNEVEIFLSVDHPNICRLAYVFEAPSMVHRDIKPSHFIFTCGCPVVTDAAHVYECPDRRLKLFDFGLARRIGSSKFIGGGTLSYMAPECLEVEWESRKPIQRRVSVFGDDDLDEQLRSGKDSEYAVASSLRKAALNMVASGLTSREVHDLEKAFVKIDIDHDGVPENDHDFEVEYSQFLAAAVHMRSEMFRDKMREIFGRFDIDGNGTISEDELKMILSHSPSTNNDDLDAEVAELLAKFDKDGNGVIDYEEFLTAMDDDEGSRDKTWIWAQRHEIHSAPLLDKHSPYVGTFAHAPGGSPLSRGSLSTLPRDLASSSPRMSAYHQSPVTSVVRAVHPLPKPMRSAAVCCDRGCNVM